jgi:PAC2 family
LRQPLAVVALEGWFDAGGAATGAVEWLVDRRRASPVAHIEAEEYFDFQQQRPEVRMDDDGQRSIDWPDTRVHLAAYPAGAHDLLLVNGIEPHLRWRQFVDDVMETIRQSGAQLVITLGAMVAEVSHNRPVVVTGSATDVRLGRRLGLQPPTYQGPTGIIGVLHSALQESGTPAVSLRVPVPHYIASPPNPAGTQALLRRLEQVTGLSTDFAGLDDDVREWRRQVSLAVEADDEVAEYVRGLESTSDPDDLPSGDDLAAEFERFLREQNDD